MISLNDYLFSGNTVLKILHQYSSDLKSSAKLEHNPVRKGFEALYFKTFQIHISNSGHHVIVIPLFLSESRARYAASCSAAFFVLPLPTPSVFSPIRSATVKCLS